jgi:hypothetical protein
MMRRRMSGWRSAFLPIQKKVARALDKASVDNTRSVISGVGPSSKVRCNTLSPPGMFHVRPGYNFFRIPGIRTKAMALPTSRCSGHLKIPVSFDPSPFSIRVVCMYLPNGPVQSMNKMQPVFHTSGKNCIFYRD